MISSNQIWNRIRSRKRLTLIAGPCVIESEKLCRQVARKLIPLCDELGIDYVFKASYDKANRTSGKSFRGTGIEPGMEVLGRIREEFQVPVLTDVHNEEQARRAAEVIDVLQIPAFLCRQTDMLAAAVETGKIVNVKKGQFLSPPEMQQVVRKAEGFGGKKLLLTERGTTFGYNNLVSDMRAIPIMRKFGYPVVFDATHSVQMPGAGGDCSSGHSEFAPLLARCAITAGADAVFVETHPKPTEALSDGPNMVPLGKMPAFLKGLVKLYRAVN
ncbi:MAG: 3-deoxy-8-phosphooctulonate synthase [Limisphaerales bacterium]